MISDVTGDDPTHIASGPCAPDPTTYQDALEILKRYEVKAPKPVTEHLARGVKGRNPRNAQAGLPRIFKRVENRVIATAQQSLQAAAKLFIGHDIHPAVLGDSVTGEAREVAKVYGALAREVKQHGLPWQPPVALISGGETHRHRARQRARRPQRASSCSRSRADLAGAERHPRPRLRYRRHRRHRGQRRRDAGARLARRARRRNSSTPRSCSRTTTATASSSALGDLVVTGPTRTNVNDYRCILVM